MGKVVLNITMSLDGFISAPNETADNPMGDNGLRLHQWFWSPDGTFGEGLTGADKKAYDMLHQTTGAVVSGRRTYDIVNGWNGTHPVNAVPVFVVTKDVPASVPAGKSTFTFVTDGITSAVRQAKEAAGDKNVYVLGGASIAQQCIAEGLLDEMWLHVAPVLFGDGVRLFDHLGSKHIELEKLWIADGADATHMSYHIVK